MLRTRHGTPSEHLPACRCHLLVSSLSAPANIWLLLVYIFSSYILPIRLSYILIAVFGLLQIVAFAQLVRSHVSSKQFQGILLAGVVTIGILGAIAFGILTMRGWIAPWTGRFYSLWDTGYAKKYVSVVWYNSSILTTPQVYSNHRFCFRTSTNSMACLLHGPADPHLRVPCRCHPLL
jgi:asparagine N-glycosylation enzyme membrane subunit Stt3